MEHVCSFTAYHSADMHLLGGDKGHLGRDSNYNQNDMRLRIISLQLLFSLLATMPVWGQTTVIRRTTTQKVSQGKTGGQWYYGYSFSEGLARVANLNYKDGFVNKTGQQVIPCKWLEAGDFSEGLAWVIDNKDEYIHSPKNKYGFIDKSGRVVIPFAWKRAWPFSDGLALVQDDNEKYGYINKAGTLVIPCKWRYGASFSEGLVWVNDSNSRCHIINKQGQIVK